MTKSIVHAFRAGHRYIRWLALTLALAATGPGGAVTFVADDLSPDLQLIDGETYLDQVRGDKRWIGRVTYTVESVLFSGTIIVTDRGTTYYIPIIGKRDNYDGKWEYAFLENYERPREASVRTPKAPLPATASGQAMNASRGGNVMVGFLDNGAFTPFHAFYSVAGGESFDIGTLDPANNANRSSFATDVSDNGATIVGYSDTVGGATWHAFRWSTATGMVDLGSGNGPGGFSRAFGVSGDGATIVGESDFPGGFSGTVRQAFRWTAAGGMVSLGSILPNWHSVATAVSADGQTVVGKSGVPFGNVNRDRAFRWNAAEGMRDLGVLPGFESSVATATNDTGSIVVGMLIPSSPASNGQAGGAFIHGSTTRAFYWTASGGMKELSTLLTAKGADLSGTQLLTATGISPDGQYISGISRRTVNGVAEERAFLVKLCGPEIGGPCNPAQAAQPPAGYALAAASSALSVAAGQAASTTVTVSPSNGFTGQVSFACSNLPASAACTFSPQQVTVSGGAASTTLTLSTSGAAVAQAPGPRHDPRLAGGAPATLAAGAFIACGWLAGRRRRRDVLPVLLAMVLAGAFVTACGGGGGGGGGDGGASGGAAAGSSGTPAGTFPVTVTATSGSGATAVTKSVVVTLSVTR